MYGDNSMARILGSGMSALREFVNRCLAAGGIPIVRTRYGKKRLPGNKVVVACWGKGAEVPGGTITDIPVDIIEKLERTTGDWQWLKGL